MAGSYGFQVVECKTSSRHLEMLSRLRSTPFSERPYGKTDYNPATKCHREVRRESEGKGKPVGRELVVSGVVAQPGKSQENCLHLFAIYSLGVSSRGERTLYKQGKKSRKYY